MLCSLFRGLWFRMINGLMTFRFVVLMRILITDIINENTDKIINQVFRLMYFLIMPIYNTDYVK